MQGYCSHSFIEVLNCQTYWYLVVALIVFCWLYNRLIDYAFSHGHERDTTVWFVVGGVSTVGVVFALVYGVDAALVMASLFVFSGVVMIFGAYRRNTNAKDADNKELMEAARLSVKATFDKLTGDK